MFSFVPPDGHFILAEYDVQGLTNSLEKQVPIWIHCNREEKAGKEASTFRIEIGSNTTVENLEISFDTRGKECTIETTVTGGNQSDGRVVGEDVNTLKGIVHHDSKSGVLRWNVDKVESRQKPLILTGTIKG